MTIRGRVKKGKVLLDKPLAFADGTEVEVRPVTPRKTGAKKAKPAKPRIRLRSLAERFANVAGQATGLPPDASINHDHYLYGTPKKQ